MSKNGEKVIQTVSFKKKSKQKPPPKKRAKKAKYADIEGCPAEIVSDNDDYLAYRIKLKAGEDKPLCHTIVRVCISILGIGENVLEVMHGKTKRLRTDLFSGGAEVVIPANSFYSYQNVDTNAVFIRLTVYKNDCEGSYELH